METEPKYNRGDKHSGRSLTTFKVTLEEREFTLIKLGSTPAKANQVSDLTMG